MDTSCPYKLPEKSRRCASRFGMFCPKVGRSPIETAAWYKALFEQNIVVSTTQLDEYIKKAQSAGLKWSHS